MPQVAYRAIRGRKKFANAPEVQKAMAVFLDTVSKPELIALHKERVANWTTKVDFKARKSLTKDAMSVTVYPTGAGKQIYLFVSEGTKPHPITAVNARFLSFVWGGKGSYVPKTTPNNGFGGPVNVVNGTRIYRRAVRHPGTEARNFPQFIRTQYAPEYKRTAEKAWRAAIRNL